MLQFLIAASLCITSPSLLSQINRTGFLQPGRHPFHSQAGQDYFAYLILYEILEQKQLGHYLEIGAGDPIHFNNSCFFEKSLNWHGISIDNNSQLRVRWATQRHNPLLICDATQADYTAILEKFPSDIDYLSLDIDRYYDAVLAKIPFDQYRFKVITIEHDAYRFGDIYRAKEREMLSNLGYYLLCADVTIAPDTVFEDWWVHPDFFSQEIIDDLSALPLSGKDYNEMIRLIQDYLR